MDRASSYNLTRAKKVNRGTLLTEKSNNRSDDLDSITTSQFVDIFVDEDKKPQEAVSKAKDQITLAIDEIYLKLKLGGRLFYIGAGTSGRLGVLDAAECPPTFCTSPDLVQAVIAGGFKSLVESSENQEDNESSSINDLQIRGFSENDCLVGITAGGTTPYVLSALDYCKRIGGLNIIITSIPEVDLTLQYDIVIRLITGPELVTGSTRLKAATATKMTLNIISTGVMVKLGKVYKNKMIDVSISNSKLLDRSTRILIELLDINLEEAMNLLKLSNGSTKNAILMGIAKLSYNEALEILARNDQSLRKSLEELGLELI